MSTDATGLVTPDAPGQGETAPSPETLAMIEFKAAAKAMKAAKDAYDAATVAYGAAIKKLSEAVTK